MALSAMGIIFSNIHNEDFNELTASESIGAIPFAGKYRLIDFSLSNMHNSDITNVNVIAKNHYQSLIRHLGSGKEWGLSRKKNGLLIFPPFSNTQSGYYGNQIEALYGILPHIRKSKCEHILITDCNVICKMDWRRPLEFHITKKADITIIYYNQVEGSDDRGTLYRISSEGYVEDISINQLISSNTSVGANMWIIGRELLVSLVEDAMAHSYVDIERDIFQRNLAKYCIAAWKYQGYIKMLNSLTDYYNASIDILNTAINKELFTMNGSIYTKNTDEVPTRYGKFAEVSNSIIADGCVIEGSVENSILFSGVYVGKGTRISNCILMKHTRAGENVKMSYVLADKNVEFSNNSELKGYEKKPLYIKAENIVSQ